MRALARGLAVVLVALAGCEAARGDADDDGAARCHGGYGVAVHVAVAATGCAAASAFSHSQLRLSSAGAEHVHDYGLLALDIAEPWPEDFFLGDPGVAELQAEGAGCTLAGTGTFIVDPAACVTVEIATTCSCAAADAGSD